MRRLQYILTILLLNINLIHAYQNNTPMYNSTPQIGYTTNYGNTFKPTQLAEQPTQMYTTTYEGTYNPATNTNRVSSSQPRRAKGGSTSDGFTVTYETIYESGILREKFTIIYTYPDGHKEEEHVTGWFEVFFIEEYAAQQAKIRAEQWAAAHATPIGGATTPLLLLMFAYLSYHEIKKRRHCKHFFCNFFHKTFG